MTMTGYVCDPLSISQANAECSQPSTLLLRFAKWRFRLAFSKRGEEEKTASCTDKNEPNHRAVHQLLLTTHKIRFVKPMKLHSPHHRKAHQPQYSLVEFMFRQC